MPTSSSCNQFLKTTGCLFGVMLKSCGCVLTLQNLKGQFWVFTKTVKILSRFGVLIRFKGMLFDFLGLYWSNKVILQPFFSMIGRQGQFRKAAYVCFWGRVLLISLLWWQPQMIRYASSYSHLEYSRYICFWGRVLLISLLFSLSQDWTGKDFRAIMNDVEKTKGTKKMQHNPCVWEYFAADRDKLMWKKKDQISGLFWQKHNGLYIKNFMSAVGCFWNFQFVSLWLQLIGLKWDCVWGWLLPILLLWLQPKKKQFFSSFWGYFWDIKKDKMQQGLFWFDWILL
ncbi:hypothetical protein LXL04_015173 [Taraxacum kok-saghyz]